MYKTIWHAGDIITTEKWNNIQNNLSPFEAARYAPYDSENSWYEITLSELRSLGEKGTIIWTLRSDNDDSAVIELLDYADSWNVEPTNGYIYYDNLK